jgi:hypothetical protein
VIPWDVGGVVCAQKSNLDEKQKEEIVLSSSFVEKQVWMARGEWNGDQQILMMRYLWCAKNMK